jgi:hypothetical protein
MQVQVVGHKKYKKNIIQVVVSIYNEIILWTLMKYKETHL